MQVAEGSSNPRPLAWITKVGASGILRFAFICPDCGRNEGAIKLGVMVSRPMMRAMLNLAVDTHRRQHSDS